MVRLGLEWSVAMVAADSGDGGAMSNHPDVIIHFADSIMTVYYAEHLQL